MKKDPELIAEMNKRKSYIDTKRNNNNKLYQQQIVEPLQDERNHPTANERQPQYSGQTRRLSNHNVYGQQNQANNNQTTNGYYWVRDENLPAQQPMENHQEDPFLSERRKMIQDQSPSVTQSIPWPPLPQHVQLPQYNMPTMMPGMFPPHPLRSQVAY